MRTRLATSALLLAFTLDFATSARAAQIVQSAEVIDTTCQQCGFGVGFNQFDPALGQLTNVTLTISGVDNFSISFQPDSPCDYDPDGACGFDFGFSVGFTINGPGLPFADPFYTADFFAMANWVGSADTSDLSAQSNTTDIFFETTPFSFLGYLGTGEVDLNIGEGEDSDFCRFNFGYCNMSSTADIATTLTYTYTPAPEASSAPMVAAGMAVIGAIGWRKRKQATV